MANINLSEQNMKQPGTKPKDGKIVLNIGEISEIAPGRGEKPNENLTGNFFIDTYNKINGFFLRMTTIKVTDKMVFYQLLSTMLNAGISLVKCLDMMIEQIKNPRFKKVIWEVANSIEKGSTFSEALSLYPSVFADSDIGMITSGEISGKLNEVLKQLALQMEKSSSLSSKIKGAMFYPTTVLIMLGIAIVTILTVVVPKLQGLFTSSGKELPTVTKYLIIASDYTIQYWSVILIIVVGLVIMFMGWKRTPSGKYSWDELKLHLPIFGELFRKVAVARFARTLSSLFASGVPIVKSLKICSQVVGNEVYREKLLSAAEDVQRGIPLGENLSGDTFIFPTMVVYMIAIGEKTAQIGELSEKVALFYEDEVNTMVNSFSKLIEPLIIMTLAGGVIFVIFAVMQPVMEMSNIGF